MAPKMKGLSQQSTILRRADHDIWIALFDTTPSNGAMAFIPRSHKLGVLRHRLNGDAREANSLECCGEFDRTAAKLCPIRAGGITIHHGCTIFSCRHRGT